MAEGLNEIPQIPEEVRQFVIELHVNKGIDELRNTLLHADPNFGKHGDINNPNRMMRALEVIINTGNPITFYQTGEKKTREFEVSYQIMELPREELYRRINTRVDEMIDAGLEEEVRSLLEHQSRPALQTVGYREFFDYFNGLYSKEFAIEKIKQHTRNYAKRQMTWFSKYSS